MELCPYSYIENSLEDANRSVTTCSDFDDEHGNIASSSSRRCSSPIASLILSDGQTDHDDLPNSADVTWIILDGAQTMDSSWFSQAIRWCSS